MDQTGNTGRPGVTVAALVMATGIPGTPTFVLSRAGEAAAVEPFYGNQPMQRFRDAHARARAGD